MALIIKFVVGFGLVGLIVSFSAGILGGNRLTYVVITAFICTLISGAMGAGIYKFFELKVPELLDLFSGRESEGESASYEEAEEYAPAAEADMEYGAGRPESFGTTERIAGAPRVPPEAQQVPGRGETQVFGDHLLVNKVKIKNEPRLIAQAIRTMLAKDES